MKCIAILCTARYALRDELQPSVSFLEKNNIKVILGDTIDKVHHQAGGTVEERVADFIKQFTNPQVDALWIARGGYGTIELLEYLDFDSIMLSRKRNSNNHFPILIGYSDVTLLHAVWANHNWDSLHNFMPLELPKKNQQNLSVFIDALKGKKLTTKAQVLSNKNKKEQFTGDVVGGNLSILNSLLGSTDFPECDGKILFIEEIDEYLYHVERMLYSLKRANKLNNLKALILGGFTDMHDHDIPLGKNITDIITLITREYDYPVLTDFPAGHVSYHHPIKLGAAMTFTIKNNSAIISQ